MQMLLWHHNFASIGLKLFWWEKGLGGNILPLRSPPCHLWTSLFEILDYVLWGKLSFPTLFREEIFFLYFLYILKHRTYRITVMSLSDLNLHILTYEFLSPWNKLRTVQVKKLLMKKIRFLANQWG